MPRDLFGDVSGPSIRIGGRKWYSLPLSLAAHIAVVTVLVVVPLMAVDALPAPDAIGAWIAPPPMPVPPPPPPAPRPPARRTAERPTTAAPVEAPDRIAPETGIEPGIERSDADIGVAGSLVVGSASLPASPPPPPPSPPMPIRVGDRIAMPRKIVDVTPVYPTMAQLARIEGTVVIEATIGTDGRVTGVQLLQSIPPLDDAAIDAVRKWQYTPTYLNGVPVPVIMTVTVQFKLK